MSRRAAVITLLSTVCIAGLLTMISAANLRGRTLSDKQPAYIGKVLRCLEDTNIKLMTHGFVNGSYRWTMMYHGEELIAIRYKDIPTALRRSREISQYQDVAKPEYAVSHNNYIIVSSTNQSELIASSCFTPSIGG